MSGFSFSLSKLATGWQPQTSGILGMRHVWGCGWFPRPRTRMSALRYNNICRGRPKCRPSVDLAGRTHGCAPTNQFMRPATQKNETNPFYCKRMNTIIVQRIYFVGQDQQGAERRASDPAYSNKNVIAREDTPVAVRSNPIKFLEIASSLDDSLLATTLWNSGGRLESPVAPIAGSAGMRIRRLPGPQYFWFFVKNIDILKKMFYQNKILKFGMEDWSFSYE